MALGKDQRTNTTKGCLLGRLDYDYDIYSSELIWEDMCI